MIFDKSKVYTALNAEDIEIGSEVVAANNLKDVFGIVNEGCDSEQIIDNWTLV